MHDKSPLLLVQTPGDNYPLCNLLFSAEITRSSQKEMERLIMAATATALYY